MVTSSSDEEAIFAAARRIATPEARRTYVERACCDDARLRARIGDLLRVYEHDHSFLESPIEELQPAAEHAVSEYVGSMIGPYKLLEQIGEGGMGLVYMAEQQQPVRRHVALKIIKPGMDNRQFMARFEAERQAVAMMDHSNIAKVLDAGTTEMGRPYFVMELVKGTPITRYCDQQHLTLSERLAIFVPVCQAVQHAHQKGIIHRDIKPTNILVALYDGVPVPKVIDFGVAKATAQELTEKTIFTGFGQLIGTLEYMSPEQAQFNQLDIDTRSDIYSLGVLLYELLAGATPFDQAHLRTVTFEETLRIIREVAPPKPSTKISASETLATIAANRSAEPALLGRQIKGDLDWIVMKCLEKDRGRRYETANGLAMDLRRYLDDEPVAARPPSSAYLLRKFIQRNRGPVVSACLLLLALVGGIIGTTWGMIRAEMAQQAEVRRAEGESRAKEQVQKRLAQIENATEILANVFRDLDPEAAENEGVTLRALLAQRTNEAAQQLEGEVVGDPLVVARLQHVLGISLRDLGDLKQAEAVLVKASRTREQLLGADHLDALATKHHLAMLYRAQAKFALAETLYKEVLNGRTAKLGLEHADTLLSQHHLAMLFHSQNDFDAAERQYKEVLKRRTATLGADHLDTLATQHRLATLYRSQGNFDLAETLCKEVLERRTARLGADHLYTLTSKQLLAALYVSQQKHELAEPLYKEVLELRRSKLGPDHLDTLGTLHHLGLLYRYMKRPDLSIPLLEEALKLRMPKLEPGHPDTLGTKADLGISYSDGGRLAEAIALLEEVHQKNRGYDATPRVGDDLLTAYVRAGKTTKAISLTTEEVRAAREMFPSDSPALIATIADAGKALLDLKAYADAEPLLLEACSGLLERESQIPQDDNMSLIQALERLVQLYDAWGKPDKAAQWRKWLEERSVVPVK